MKTTTTTTGKINPKKAAPKGKRRTDADCLTPPRPKSTGKARKERPVPKEKPVPVIDLAKPPVGAAKLADDLAAQKRSEAEAAEALRREEMSAKARRTEDRRNRRRARTHAQKRYAARSKNSRRDTRNAHTGWSPNDGVRPPKMDRLLKMALNNRLPYNGATAGTGTR